MKKSAQNSRRKVIASNKKTMPNDQEQKTKNTQQKNTSSSETLSKKSTKTGRLDFYLLRRLGQYVRVRIVSVITIVVLMICSNIASVSHPYILRIGIDDYIEKGDFQGLKLVAWLLFVALVITFLFTLSYNYLIQHLGQHLIKAIRIDIAKKALAMSRSYFDRTPIGQTLTLLTNDVESIREFIANGVASILANFLTIFFLFSIMFYISPPLTAMVALSVPLFATATYLFKVALRGGYRGVRQANSGMNIQLVESITGMKEILLFNHRQKSIEQFDKVNVDYRNSFMKIVRSYSLYFPVIEGITALSMVGIISASYLLMDTMPSFGNLFAFFIYINMLFRPLRDLAEQFNTLQSAMSGAERIFTFLDNRNNTYLEFPSQTALLPSAKAPADESVELPGSIEFRNVHFGYEKGSPVLKGLSFSIQPGEKIAIVGSTGAGKSTIVSLMNRLYNVTSGQIMIGGKSIESIPLKVLRRNISTIPQDVFLFSGSFRENILLGKTLPDDKLEKAGEQALIDDIIARRNSKYDARVLEEGKSLSTGQKQLLAFARAFIKDAPIVILDEATANIDTESERKIETALERLTQKRTSIIIAHRLSTIRHADRILVLHQGRLLETGSHRELIAKEGFYHKLYRMQQIQLQSA